MGCKKHPQAFEWESSTGSRCSICGVPLSGMALEPAEPVEIRSLDLYQEKAARTSGGYEEHMTDRRIAMACMGLAGEAGEFVDLMKKHIFHRHPLDKDKAARELGDVMWYLAEAASALGLKLSDIATMNIEKLRVRYPEKFDPERSINRAVGDT